MGNNCCSSRENQQLLQKPKIKFENYQKRYNDRKTKGINYYNDIVEKENFVSNYKLYLSKLNNELSSLKDLLNISSFEDKKEEKIKNLDEKNELINDLREITNKINEFQNILEKQKTLMKNLENNLNMIQEQINDIYKKFQIKDVIINNA